MTRELTTTVANAIEATEVAPILFFEGEFVDGWVRMWTGYGELTWDGKIWTGFGNFMSVSAIDETQDIQANGINLILSGIPSDLLSLALDNVQQNKVGRVYIGFLDANSQIIPEPYMLFEGRLDVPMIDEAGDTSVITISYESRLIDLQRPRLTRLTNEEQQREYAGDKGCEFVPAMRDITITWGKS